MDEEKSVAAARHWFRQLAHDLRQPLSTMDSTAYLLRLTNGHSQEELVRIQELIQHASQLISDAATLIDPPECVLEPVSLAGVVEKRLKLRLPSEQERIVFEAGIQPTVLADRHQIGRLIDAFLSLGIGLAEDREPVTLRLVAPAVLVWSLTGSAVDSRQMSVEAVRQLCVRQEGSFSAERDTDGKLLLRLELLRV